MLYLEYIYTKNYVVFICNSNLTGVLHFHLLNLAILLMVYQANKECEVIDLLSALGMGEGIN